MNEERLNKLFEYAENNSYQTIMLNEKGFEFKEVNLMLLYKTRIDKMNKELVK